MDLFTLIFAKANVDNFQHLFNRFFFHTGRDPQRLVHIKSLPVSGSVHNIGSVYTKRQSQCCDNASSAVLIENNGVALKWVATPMYSDSIVFSDSSIVSIIAALTQC